MRIPMIASIFKFITNLWTISVLGTRQMHLLAKILRMEIVARHGTTHQHEHSSAKEPTAVQTNNLITQSKSKLFEEVKPKCRFKS